MGRAKPGKTPAESPPAILPRALAAYQRTLMQSAPAGNDPPEGFLKTGGVPLHKPQAPLRKPPSGDSKYRRVAKFLILIGSEAAAKILSSLEPDQVEAVSREIASVRGITAEEGEVLLEEFRSLFSASYAYSGSASGGVEEARRLLYAAFGPEKGEAFLNRSLPETRENSLGFLEDFTGEQLAFLLKDESPAAAALILSRLSSGLSAAALGACTPERKLEIVKRIARMDQIAPDVLDRAAAALREKARHIGAVSEGVEMDGKNILAAILRQSDLSFGDRILEELEDADGDLGRDLKERLYTLDDVIRAEDRPLQEKLRSMPDRDIALLLKGRSPEFAEKILSNVSAQRRSLIREEGDIMGAVPKTDTEAAGRNFLAWFRLNREDGRILLVDDEDVIE
jgi:flagellar motor switch protein FliG